jgi:hypothetical protein
MLRNVPVKIGQSLPAGPANISHFFPPRLGPLIAMGLRHGGCGFVVLCDSGKIGIEQLLTVIERHSGIIFIDARPPLSGKPRLCLLGRTMNQGAFLGPYRKTRLFVQEYPSSTSLNRVDLTLVIGRI